MKNSGFIVKLAAILFAIAFVCTFILVLCNYITEPIINENTIKAEEEARQEVLSTAEKFIKKDDFTSEGIAEAFEGINDNGEVVGYVFKVSTKDNENKAFGGEIQMIVGIDTDLKVTGVNITSMAETPGLGAKANEDDFKGQFTGKSGEIEVVKSGAKDNQVQAISGATITSKAVTEGINNAIKAAEALKGKEAK